MILISISDQIKISKQGHSRKSIKSRHSQSPDEVFLPVTIQNRFFPFDHNSPCKQVYHMQQMLCFRKIDSSAGLHQIILGTKKRYSLPIWLWRYLQKWESNGVLRLLLLTEPVAKSFYHDSIYQARQNEIDQTHHLLLSIGLIDSRGVYRVKIRYDESGSGDPNDHLETQTVGQDHKLFVDNQETNDP